MTLFVTESEMISRYSDSLKKAAARAKEITEAKEQDKAEIFVDFVDGLKVAAGSAHQLAHAQENPYWLNIRDKLESIVELGQNLPVFKESENTLWKTIQTALLGMAESGQKLFLRKAMTRTDVLKNLDLRELNLKNSIDG